KVDVDANLTPRGVFPLKNAVAALELADESALHAQVDWTSTSRDGAIQDRLAGTLSTEKLNVGQLVGDAIPDLLLTMAADFDIELLDHTDFQQGRLDLDIQEGSRWNKQALSGHLKSEIVNTGQAGQAPVVKVDDPAKQAQAGIEPVADAHQDPLWKGLRLTAINMDLQLGKNSLKADGALGMTDSRINLDLSAPELDAFWPDLPGGAELKGVLAGELARHEADLTAQYTPALSEAGKLGKAPMRAHLVLEGGWGWADSTPDSPEGWRGSLKTLQAEHASLGLKTGEPVPISFFPG